MDFSIFSKLKDNKLWWVDVVFYFIISSLVATVFCYLIFSVKIYMQKSSIEDYAASLATVGTDEQKEMEKQIFEAQRKINDYAPLIRGHRISSNLLAFLEQNTLPKVWFSKFSISGEDADITLSGQAETVEIFSRQIQIFEENPYLTKITVLGSTLGPLNKVDFNLALSLDPTIFTFASEAEATPTPTPTPVPGEE